VDERLTSISDIVLSDRGFSVLTRDIPNVGMSVDHQCLVWCKQLLFALTSGLYAAIDKNTGRMHTTPEVRMQALSKFLLPKSWAAERQSHAKILREGTILKDAEDKRVLPSMVVAHDYVRRKVNPTNTTAQGSPRNQSESLFESAADVVRQYGSLLISIAIGITAFSLAYQLYNVVASESKRDLMPSFREALRPENHLAHILTGVVATRPNSAAKAKVFQAIIAAAGVGATVSTSMFKSVEISVLRVLPHVLEDAVLYARHFLKNIVMAVMRVQDYPPFWVVVVLYLAALGGLIVLDAFLSVVQRAMGVATAPCSGFCSAQGRRLDKTKKKRGCARHAQKLLDILMFPTTKMGLLTIFVSTWLFLLCVVGPVLTFKHKGSNVDNSPTPRALLSMSKIGAAVYAAVFLLLVVLLIITFLTPAYTPTSWVSPTTKDVQSLGQMRMLHSVGIIVLLSLPLQAPGLLLACDVLRTPTEFISWGQLVDVWFFRLSTLVPLFLALYCALAATSGPSRCQTEDAMYKQKYVIGSDTFYYDRRAAPPPSVAAGMRVAYWRVSQYEKISLVVEGVKKTQKDHEQLGAVVRAAVAAGSVVSTEKEGQHAAAEKLFQKCLGMIDLFEKYLPKLDVISSIPPFENSIPCPRVRMMRKATVNEIKTQLKAADALKEVAAALVAHTKKDKISDAVWPNEDDVPVIPEIVAPKESKPDEGSAGAEVGGMDGPGADGASASVGAAASSSGGDNAAEDVFQVPEDYGFLELSMLGSLFLGLGVSNFFWNLVPMYRSQYFVAVACILIFSRR
jgi:hypothetical protein